MKQKNFPRLQNKELTNKSPSTLVGPAAFNQGPQDFVPSPDEVARKAYFAYVNEGSPEGRDVQHWLDAEAALTEERNLTRVHAFHNHT
jgi:hypothetical protein